MGYININNHIGIAYKWFKISSTMVSITIVIITKGLTLFHHNNSMYSILYNGILSPLISIGLLYTCIIV